VGQRGDEGSNNVRKRDFQNSYEVERDYWEWEAAVADEERLQQMLESFP
jgi:hypothetical protein